MGRLCPRAMGWRRPQSGNSALRLRARHPNSSHSTCPNQELPSVAPALRGYVEIDIAEGPRNRRHFPAEVAAAGRVSFGGRRSKCSSQSQPDARCALHCSSHKPPPGNAAGSGARRQARVSMGVPGEPLRSGALVQVRARRRRRCPEAALSEGTHHEQSGSDAAAVPERPERLPDSDFARPGCRVPPRAMTATPGGL